MKKVIVGLFIFCVVLALPVSTQSLTDNPRLQSALMLLELWADAQRDYG